MRGFRNELLELLLTHSGEFISLTELTEKYCGVGNTFNQGDYSMPRCRLEINTELRELKENGWITMTTQGGLSTAHSFNRDIGKRQFIMDYEVKARMTTKGELEYKRMKLLDERPKGDIKIGDGFSGVFIQDSDLRNSPITSSVTSTPSMNAKGRETKGLWRLMSHPITVFVLTILAGLVVAYFVFLFKWN